MGLEHVEQLFTRGLLKFIATFFPPEERVYSFYQIMSSGFELPKVSEPLEEKNSWADYIF